MKKFTLAVAAIGLISLASCKKDYTCTCTDPNDPSSNASYTFKDAKKKDAKKACDAWHAIYAMDGGKCEL